MKDQKSKFKEATTKIITKQVENVSVKNNSWLKHIKNITAKPGDNPQTTFTLPKHVEDGLSALESSNKICEYFSAISQEYSPLDPETLPTRVQSKLQNDSCIHPQLEDYIVFEGLKKGKKTSSVPGDIPKKILEEFLPELTAPVAAIYREVFSSHQWPSSYKKEYHIPINKVPQPLSEDDLRNLGLTPFFSKRLEWFLIQWIWPYISNHIDIDQLGGLPDCSVEHYLILMLDFIHRHLDKNHREPTAVLAALVDFSKAFNRMDHNTIVTILSDLNVPTCALRLVVSYLSGRKMCVRYNGAVSAEQNIPGGGPQGGLLTVIFFNLQVNLAGAPCPVIPSLPLLHAGPEPDPLQAGPSPPCHLKERTLKKKYVDDLSLLEAVNLKSTLTRLPCIIGPANYHEQNGLCLPPEVSVLQHQLSDLVTFTKKNSMKINIKKTKIIPFNPTKKYDFLPQLNFPDEEPLDVIYSTKLLGVTLSSNLSWQEHVSTITKNATKKLWVLVRFKGLGGSQSQLLKVYQTRVRSTLEFAAPVFYGGLTMEQSRQIECVQKKAFAIILGRSYTSYESALTSLKQERLDTRRENLAYKFALKCTTSSRHMAMFPLNTQHRPNMRNPKPFAEPYCNTSRYYHSPIPSISRLLIRKSRKE